MTKLKLKRFDIIRQMMNGHGLELGDKVVISLWDLASNINNTWNAKYFVNTERFSSQHTSGYSLGSWQLWYLFRAIRHTVKGTRMKLVVSPRNKSEYIEWK